MISDYSKRLTISKAIGEALDELVRERYKGLVEEPDITSRVGQRLEDRFDGRTIGGHGIRVITETITSRGRGSLEKPMGTDLYIAVSVQHDDGSETSKGLLIQAKKQDKLRSDPAGLIEQCRRMTLITKKGSVVWAYGPKGIATASASDVLAGTFRAVSVSKMFEEVFECSLGDKRRVPRKGLDDREALKDMLRTLGATNGALLELQQ